MKKLLERRRGLAREFRLPEEILRGSVYIRVLRCGKSGCHCATGEGHRAAYLSVTHPGGRTEQISLPAALVPVAKRWVGAYVRLWKAVERISKINRQILRGRRASAPGQHKESGRRTNGKGGTG